MFSITLKGSIPAVTDILYTQSYTKKFWVKREQEMCFMEHWRSQGYAAWTLHVAFVWEIAFSFETKTVRCYWQSVIGLSSYRQCLHNQDFYLGKVLGNLSNDSWKWQLFTHFYSRQNDSCFLKTFGKAAVVAHACRAKLLRSWFESRQMRGFFLLLLLISSLSLPSFLYLWECLLSGLSKSRGISNCVLWKKYNKRWMSSWAAWGKTSLISSDWLKKDFWRCACTNSFIVAAMKDNFSVS